MMFGMSPVLVVFLASAFAYAGYASVRAYRETGERWMLLLPQWIDRKSGVSEPTRRHGRWAFGILFVATGLLLFAR